MNDWNEELFDSNTVEKAVRKGKQKSIALMIGISIFVFVLFTMINLLVYSYTSNRAFEARDAYVQLTTPNGYISQTSDSKGLLGGETHYKVSKDMKIKSPVVEQNHYSFGLLPSLTISRGAGGKIGVGEEKWLANYKENGWRELMFFHPAIDYQRYKNDWEWVEEMEEDKIYELALSFDRPYSYDELPLKVLSSVSWLWLNTYSEEDMEVLEKEAIEHDASSTFIKEGHALGFSTRHLDSPGLFQDNYDEFLTRLETSDWGSHQEVHDRMVDMASEELEILGIVVYGTKEELESIINRPYIKAVSLGGMIDNY